MVSSAHAINNAGQFVGDCLGFEDKPSWNSLGYFYDSYNESSSFIGTLGGSWAWAINDFGHVVGIDTNATYPYNQFPFLLIDGVEYNLKDCIVPPNPVLEGINVAPPFAINNRGESLINTFSPLGPILLTPLEEER